MSSVTRRDFVAWSAGLFTACTTAPTALAQRVPDERAPITATDMAQQMRGLLEGKLTCVRTPEAPDGPFYMPKSKLRRSLLEDRRGLRVRLGITVASALQPGNTCAPLRGAIVDVWQADASGLYSNVAANAQHADTSGATFLRGHQITDAAGYVEFDTIVPGWYVQPAPPLGLVPRTSHVHLKVFHEYKIATAQLFFPDAFLDEVYANVQPYAAHRTMTPVGETRRFERIPNTEDGVFLLNLSTPMTVKREGDGAFAAATIGLVTTSMIGIAPPPFR